MLRKTPLLEPLPTAEKYDLKGALSTSPSNMWTRKSLAAGILGGHSLLSVFQLNILLLPKSVDLLNILVPMRAFDEQAVFRISEL